MMAQLLRIDMPHKATDVLQLTAPGSVLSHFLASANGFTQFIGQVQTGHLDFFQQDQLLAQCLRSQSRLFLLGAARFVTVRFGGFDVRFQF